MNTFPTMDRINEMLSEIADEIPIEFFTDLHGGILLVEASKQHAESMESRPLYIMGEYVRNVMGSQIKIYYGSFSNIYAKASESRIRSELKKTLIHEFTHHLEYRAGLRGLEVKDAKQINAYRNKK